jgi:serine/threonine protein kinase
MPLNDIRPVAQQVLVALEKLAQLQIIHGDLKPENIMMVDSLQKPLKIKVSAFIRPWHFK